jgi:PAS domain S-box-containing protein
LIKQSNDQAVVLQISNKQFVLALTLMLTFFPYAWFAKKLALNEITVSNLALMTLQVISIIFVVVSYLRIKAKALRLFWQFISLALLSTLIINAIFAWFPNIATPLLTDFFYLFSYFFILLAIETSPHIKERIANISISTRVPAIFFTLICFSYFILLPAEFAKDIQAKNASSTLFHLLITALIFIRLAVTTYHCKALFWCRIFGLLALAAAAVFLDNAFIYGQLNQQQLIPTYWQTLLTLLPYCALVFSVNNSSPIAPLPQILPKTNFPELYLVLLTASLVFIHIIGFEFSLHYHLSTYLQSVLIGIWLVIATTILIVICKRKNGFITKQNEQLGLQKQAQIELVKLNKTLADSLLNSEDKAIVNASNNAILTTKTNGKILSANPAAIQMFQCLEHDIIGTNVSHFFSSDDAMHYFFDFKSNIYTLQRKDRGISIECISSRNDGTQFPVQAELQWAEREDAPLIVITFINLTARKLAEKQALDLKDKFIANISHEFRTPLTIINGILDRYLIKSQNDEESVELTTAKRNGLRLVRMVEQLLELSRLSDNPKLSLSTFRLKTLMSMPADSFARLAKQNHLSLTSHIPDNIWLECDAQAFEKILFNLLANAIKYTPEGGEITVQASLNGDTFTIEVIDTGIGINKESQAKIFERFQRADDQKNQAVFGVGIGLSLVNELVKAHNWQISLVSEYNHGSKFSLTIPCAEPLKIETELPCSVSQTEVSSLLTEQKSNKKVQTQHSHKVVLVIEDNLDMQGHIKQVIEQQHHCLLAISGEIGLALAQEYLPDLIVCDIMLTGIDGFEVLQNLKQHELTSHIPVILLTARSDLDSRIQGLDLQADEYLSKPFNQQELLSRIGNLILSREKLQQSFNASFNDVLKGERKQNSIQKGAQLSNIVEDENSSVDKKFLDKLEKVTAKMYIEPDLDIIQLASEMAMSERQLQRKIKVLLGTTPNNFIKEFRLNQAHCLLKNGSQIGRIALDVGFSSQTYFGRCFKEKYQCTPKQFQQQHQQVLRPKDE